MISVCVSVADKGDMFGWGNSEYHQLSSVSGDETQVSFSRRLPFSDVGRVSKVAAAGSMLALLNGQYSSAYGAQGIPNNYILAGRKCFSSLGDMERLGERGLLQQYGGVIIIIYSFIKRKNSKNYFYALVHDV